MCTTVCQIEMNVKYWNCEFINKIHFARNTEAMLENLWEIFYIEKHSLATEVFVQQLAAYK